MKGGVEVGTIQIGAGAPLALISGLNVIESEAATLATARSLRELGERHAIPLIFKASFDKANRSSFQSYRGVGLDAGLRILERVRQELSLPLLTDIHEPGQAKLAAEIVDCLQIPAYLCRQTDLIAACAATGLPIHLKKGQFMAPDDMELAADKARHFGASGVFISERGTSFGYRDLVVDFRGLGRMRHFAPVAFDATHAAQLPGAGAGQSGGERSVVAPLARAAVAAGVDALFIEVHPEPERALCDSACQIDFESLERLVADALAIERSLCAAEPSAPSR